MTFTAFGVTSWYRDSAGVYSDGVAALSYDLKVNNRKA